MRWAPCNSDPYSLCVVQDVEILISLSRKVLGPSLFIVRMSSSFARYVCFVYRAPFSVILYLLLDHLWWFRLMRRGLLDFTLRMEINEKGFCFAVVKTESALDGSLILCSLVHSSSTCCWPMNLLNLSFNQISMIRVWIFNDDNHQNFEPWWCSTFIDEVISFYSGNVSTYISDNGRNG